MEDALEIAAAKRGRKTDPRTSADEKERELLFPCELRRNKRGKRARGEESVKREAKKRKRTAITRKMERKREKKK